MRFEQRMVSSDAGSSVEGALWSIFLLERERRTVTIPATLRTALSCRGPDNGREETHAIEVGPSTSVRN